MTVPDAGIPAPLDAVLQNSVKAYNRILLRNGVQLRRTGHPTGNVQWKALGDRGFETVAPEALQDLFSSGLACVGVRDAWDSLRWFSAPREHGPVLELQWQQLRTDLLGRLPDGARGQGLNLVYILGSVLHHLVNLASLYSEIAARAFSRPPFGAIKGDRVVLSGEVEPYFEIEALISAAARTFETARYVIWQGFGPGRDTPRNFDLVIKNLNLPESIEAEGSVWQQDYARLRDFRDCLHHNAHFGARLPFSMGNRVSGFWGLLNRLPDNPETKSYEQFTFAENLDALDYGWGLANDLFFMTDKVFRALAVSTS